MQICNDSIPLSITTLRPIHNNLFGNLARHQRLDFYKSFEKNQDEQRQRTRRATTILLSGVEEKGKTFCLKNVSNGQRAEEANATLGITEGEAAGRLFRKNSHFCDLRIKFRNSLESFEELKC